MSSESRTAHRAAEIAARESYGRIVAYLARRWRDLAAAEDAVSEALRAALETWPERGIPASPEAWLLDVSRRSLIDAGRHAVIAARSETVDPPASSPDAPDLHLTSVPDDRLRLMLVCAHPAIDEAVRPALVLQTVLGLDAKTIAGAFLVSSEAMTKRLVRAKRKIRDAGLRFEEPDPGDLRERVHAVLEAIYAAYALSGEGAVADGDARDDLASEAIYLARVVTELSPSAEAIGLLALLQFLEARRPAQVNAAGEFVPLLEQDPGAWDAPLLERSYALLACAAAQGEPGPFQLEAAIQAAHCHRARTGVVPWSEIRELYRALVTVYPTVGSRVAFAVATAQVDGAAQGFRVLAELDLDQVLSYQPWWVASAHLHQLSGERAEAARCLERALGLTSQVRIRRFLQSKLRALREG